MTFTQDVKNELVQLKETTAVSRSVILNGLVYCMRKKNDCLHFSSENEHITSFLKKLLIGCDFAVSDKAIIIKEKKLINIALPTGGDNEAGLFLRGVFLAGGALLNPQKGYHLEISVPDSIKCGKLSAFISEHGIPVSEAERKSKPFIYIKESERIVDFLTYVGAVHHSMEIMNTKILKEVRNNINRTVNCEAANIEKTAKAASRQIADIELIYSLKGEVFLPPELRAVADIRLNNIEMSLKEIGEACEPKISRSGVNHRLAKIGRIAKALRSK